jgi:enoyl-CoA hydratase
MSDFILNERRGDGAYITINRADVNGVITDAMAADLAGMIDEAGKTSKFIVYRSAGADFCTGRDRGVNVRPKEALDYKDSSEDVFGFYDSFRRSPIPIVAAVQGRALGMGCAVAALCDIALACDDARFALTEMAHRTLPTIAMSGLIDRVGRKGITYLTYTALEVDAQTALAYGIVSFVVPKGEIDGALDRVTKAIDNAPMPAVHAAKEYIGVALDLDVRSATAYAKNLHATVNTSSRMRP